MSIKHALLSVKASTVSLALAWKANLSLNLPFTTSSQIFANLLDVVMLDFEYELANIRFLSACIELESIVNMYGLLYRTHASEGPHGMRQSR